MKNLLSLLLFCGTIFMAKATNGEPASAMEQVWQEFRHNHPYCFQTVGLKHQGDECIFVISEPAESVLPAQVEELFRSYGGSTEVKQTPLGYDGWLADIVGHAKFANDGQQEKFTHDLFTLLYGSDYKAYYTDLDHPTPHIYYSPYDLNQSVSAAELDEWFLNNRELFTTSEGKDATVQTLLSSAVPASNELLFSKEPGFVAWRINTNKIKATDELFKQNARRFALDTDLIIGAFGTKGKSVVIIARERQVPVEALPPLRTETLQMLATTNKENLAQSYERYHVFASKLKGNADVAPIYLSDELWHTEYGNLLNMTDQMLKSWSQNGKIDYLHFGYPQPIDWAFRIGAIEDLDANTLTYNWNTAGAGYVIEGEDGKPDLFAVNRTGSLPVSYIPEGMEGENNADVFAAEERAYDFFSGLNNPDLVRVVQYATLYQIFTYFKDNSTNTSSPAFANLPNYGQFDSYVESLLRIASSRGTFGQSSTYTTALKRFEQRMAEYNIASRLRKMFEDDPYGELEDYLRQRIGMEKFDSLLLSRPSSSEMEELFNAYLQPNLEIVDSYIKDYEKKYGAFPYKEAAHYIVSPRDIEEIKRGTSKKISQIADTHDGEIDNYTKKLDEYNKKVKNGEATFIDKSLIDKEEEAVIKRLSAYKKQIIQEQAKLDKIEALGANTQQQQAISALNWLLTDPGEGYDVASGRFFSDKLSSHGQWTKSPSMACSMNGTGYGGHNLDAHVTPVKKSVGGVKVPSGKYRVSFVNGQRVISVYSRTERMRITPDILRKVERQVVKESEFNLPEPPKNRPKRAFLGINPERKERGLDVERHHTTTQNDEKVLYAGNTVEMNQVMEQVNHSTHQSDPVVRIDIEEYTARNMKVITETGKGVKTEQIVERSANDAFDIRNYDSESVAIEESAEGTTSTVVLDWKTSKLPRYARRAKLYLTIMKRGATNFQQSIKEALSRPSEEIDNPVKLKYMLKQNGLELQKLNCTMEDLLPQETGLNPNNNNENKNENDYEMVWTA